MDKKQKFYIFFLARKAKICLIIWWSYFFLLLWFKIHSFTHHFNVSSIFTIHHSFPLFLTTWYFCYFNESGHYKRTRSLSTFSDMVKYNWYFWNIYRSYSGYYHLLDSSEDSSAHLWSYDGWKTYVYEGYSSTCWF